jgi:dolichol-phosphate mannosyltransferase
MTPSAPLSLLLVVIPARDEQECIASTIEHLHLALRLRNVPHEIVAVDDRSSDKTCEILTKLRGKLPKLRPVQNSSQHGFGRAVARCLDEAKGDALIIVAADESDDCRDVVRYWQKLNEVTN